MPVYRVKDDLAGALSGQWKVDLTGAPCHAPGKFCYGFCCPCCFAHSQRGKLLDITGEQYLCCGGGCPCAQEPCQNREPYMCLEACCCTHVMIGMNRFMLQTRFDIQNDPCDDTLLGIAACVNVVAACAAICADRETAEHLHHCVDLMNACVCSCMLTQQAIELDAIEASQTPYGGPPPQVVYLLPPSQQAMIQATQALNHGGGGGCARPPPMAPSQQAAMAPPMQAQGRQVWLKVPEGYQPGMQVPFQTDDGRQMTAQVPNGHFPGQQFVVEV